MSECTKQPKATHLHGMLSVIGGQTSPSYTTQCNASLLSDETCSHRSLIAAADADAAGKLRGNDPGKNPQLKLAAGAAAGGKACSERCKSTAAATAACRLHGLAGPAGPYR